MKKVVVVVDRYDRFVFTGENLDVIDGTSSAGLDSGHPVKLVIRDNKKTIAVFKDWTFWKKYGKDGDPEEKSEPLSAIKKVLVRPNRIVSAAMWGQFIANLKNQQIVPVPHGWDMVIIYKSGKTKVL